MVNQGIEIRCAAAKDSRELARLNHLFNGTGTPIDHIEESLKRGNELVAVAALGGSLVGFACAQSFDSFCYRSSHGEITEMYVMEEYRRKGLASALLSLLEQGLRDRGVRSVRILTGMDNHGAIKTYASMGYAMEGEAVLEKVL